MHDKRLARHIGVRPGGFAAHDASGKCLAAQRRQAFHERSVRIGRGGRGGGATGEQGGGSDGGGKDFMKHSAS